MTEHVDVLAKAFRCLTDEEFGNLRWHQSEGAGVLCGALSHIYVSQQGFG